MNKREKVYGTLVIIATLFFTVVVLPRQLHFMLTHWSVDGFAIELIGFNTIIQVLVIVYGTEIKKVVIWLPALINALLSALILGCYLMIFLTTSPLA